MRKILIAVALVLLVILANFSLWFAHTRTITTSLETIKKKLAVQGIEFDYKEVRYTNFLAWEVKAVIDQLSFKRGSEHYYTTKKLAALELVSSPFKNRIMVTFPIQIDILTSHLKKIQEYTIQFEQSPSLRIDLFSSLAKLDDAINIGDIKYGKYIREIFYYNDIFNIIDKTNKNQLYILGDNFTIWVVNKNTEDKFTLGLKASSDKLRYHPNYVATHATQQKLYAKHLELGNIHLAINGLLQESFDQAKNKDADRAQNKEDFNTKKIEIESLKIEAKPFGIYVNGIYEKLPVDPLPFMDLKLQLREYRDFVKYYASTVNLSIEAQAYGQTMFPIKKISDEQANALAGILKRLSVDKKNESNITLEITRTKDSTTISGKPIFMIVKQLQALFLSNLPSMPAPPNTPLPNSPTLPKK